MGNARRSSHDYDELRKQYHPLTSAPLMNFGGQRRPDPTPHMDARTTARMPVTGPTTANTKVPVELAGGGRVLVNVPKGKEKDPQVVEAAINARRAVDPTLRDRAAIIRNASRHNVLQGKGNVITGVAPKEVLSPEGTTFHAMAGHMQANNKDLSRTTFSAASVGVTAGNSKATPVMVRSATLGALAGHDVTYKSDARLGIVTATNAKPDNDNPAAGPFQAKIRARKREYDYAA